MLLSMLVGLFGMLVSVALQVVVIGINIPLLLLIAPPGGMGALCVAAPLPGGALAGGASPRCCAPALHQHQRDHPRRPALRLWPGPTLLHWIRCCIIMTTTCAAGTPPPPSTAGSACTRPPALRRPGEGRGADGGLWQQARCWGRGHHLRLHRLGHAQLLIRTFAEVEQVMNAVERVREYSEIESERQDGEALATPRPQCASTTWGCATPDQPVGAAQGELRAGPRGERWVCAGVPGRAKAPLLGVLQAMYPASQGGSSTAIQPLYDLHRRRCAISTTPSPRSHSPSLATCRANLDAPDRA